jgi:hypothetical protein
MTKEEILKCLGKLGEMLAARGLAGEILLTGGAAMCIVHSARDMTKDVDALYEPKSEINEIVKQIATDGNLPDDWLNDSVKGFMTENAPSEKVMELAGLTISTVPAEYLLTMKLMSARYGEKDADDIAFLMKELNITTSEQAYDIISKYWPENKILPKTMYVIEEYINEAYIDDEKNKR